MDPLARPTTMRNRAICGVVLTLISAAMLTALELSKEKQVRASGVVEVSNEGVPRQYERAIKRILVVAREGCQELFGLDTPSELRLQLRLDPAGSRALFNDGATTIIWEVSAVEQLGPPHESGSHNVYGLCHELGHLTMYPYLQTTQGLPQGVGEGWAHYIGSAVTGYVFEELGGSVWPQPHNYSRTSGPERFAQQMKQVSGFSSPDLRAAKVYDEIEQSYGRRMLGEAMKQALTGQPKGAELMPAFREALLSVSGDPEAAALFPQEFLEPTLQWAGTKPDLSDPAIFSGLKVKANAAGLLLSYDDGAADGQLSTAGSGHAVLFPRPEGRWLLSRIDVFGARYGDPEAPAKQCTAYVCDAEMKAIRDVPVPYAIFPWGEMGWTSMRMPSVEVPKAFFVCLFFDPTADVGVYVGTDSDVQTVHSYSALPLSHASKVQGQSDWMIRVQLTAEDPALLKRAAEVAESWTP